MTEQQKELEREVHRLRSTLEVNLQLARDARQRAQAREAALIAALAAQVPHAESCMWVARLGCNCGAVEKLVPALA